MSKIVRFSSENFKRLVAVEITPESNIVILSGKNKAGKTSILDGILAVLKGRKFARETSQAIRDGQDSGWVRLEIGEDAEHIDIIATRRWTQEDSGTLTVEAADGAKYSSPQAVIDKIVGEISFDPMAFLDLEPSKQVDALVKALGPLLPFDPTKLAAERKGVYDRRADVGRDVTKLEGQLTGYAAVDPSLPAEEQSAADILAEHETARQHNAAIDQQAASIATLETAIENSEATIARLLEELDTARAYLDRAKETHDDLLAKFKTTERIDTDAITARLSGVEEVNAKIRAQKNRAAVAAELSERKAEVAQHTLKLREIDKQKADGIAAAKFPVPELSFNDDGVTYNGRALSQASTEEQMRASFGLSIVANPKLRVCRIDKGEALDSDSLKVLSALADEHNMQVWLSKVDESGSIGFVIEDGALVA